MDLNRYSIHVIDNIIPQPQQDFLETSCLSPTDDTPPIPWRWFNTTTNPLHLPPTPEGFNSFRGGQFVFNLLTHPEDKFLEDLFTTPLKSLHNRFNKDIQIVKCKSNFIFREYDADEKSLFPIHTDLPIPSPEYQFWTAIYYVNDSDGNTVIFNNRLKARKVIEPKKGRIVLFHGHHFHAGQPPIKSSKRVVINYNFILPRELNLPIPDTEFSLNKI